MNKISFLIRFHQYICWSIIGTLCIFCFTATTVASWQNKELGYVLLCLSALVVTASIFVSRGIIENMIIRSFKKFLVQEPDVQNIRIVYHELYAAEFFRSQMPRVHTLIRKEYVAGFHRNQWIIERRKEKTVALPQSTDSAVAA